jgi:hypothetical protein
MKDRIEMHTASVCPRYSLNGVARFLAFYVALQEPLQQIREDVECRLLQATQRRR